MKRSDLIRTIQVNYKRMNTEDAARLLDIIVGAIHDSVSDSNKVEIRRFGTFSLRRRAGKAESKNILFRPSPELTKEMQ